MPLERRRIPQQEAGPNTPKIAISANLPRGKYLLLHCASTCRPHHTPKAARLMSQPTPPRLSMAKTAATTAAVIATTAALTAGVASSAPEALAAHNRNVQADVELTAASSSDIGKIPNIVGLYGVGPIF